MYSNKQWTVSELSNELKNLIENKFFYVKVKGEITNYRGKSKGCFYFSIKDKDNSAINVVMWSSYASQCKFDIKDGIEINVYGKLTTWKDRSNYQIQAEKFELINKDGKLLKIIEERKQKLLKEGLFDVSKKKAIPKFPKIIGIITAENGAALQDILSRLKNRTPIKIKLYSVLVQGKTASKEIIEAIKYFNKQKEKVDVLVITRGGGSIEDLMPFNDEELAREVFKSKIPIISAVGHEIDTTIIDYVSDFRLPTPTSVAEHITISKEQANQNLINLIKNIFKVIFNKNIQKYKKIKILIRDIFKANNQKFINKKIKIDKVKIKINHLFKNKINKYKTKKYILKKINIIKIIKNLLLKHKNKVKILSLRISNCIKKNKIIIKNLLGQEIFLKSQIKDEENYIIKFIDGEIKVKIVN